MAKDFGTKLKYIRTLRKMSQDDFANFLGTSKQVISRYETNQRTPKITTANEYALKLNVPLLYLIDDNISSIDEANCSPQNLPADEKTLLGSYRKLNDLGKHTARIYVDGLTIQKEYQVAPTLKELPAHFDVAASGLDENTEAGKDNMDLALGKFEKLQQKQK